DVRERMPAGAQAGNPLDLIATCTPETYGLAVRALLEDPETDAVIALLVPLPLHDAEDFGRHIAAAARDLPNKPVLASFGGEQDSAALKSAGVPMYSFPESAARALAHAAERAAWLRRPAGKLLVFDDMSAARGREILGAALGTGGSGWLGPEEVAALLAAFGIPMPPARVAHSAEEAARAWKAIGAPSVLKLVSRTILHKSEVGGVRLGVTSAGKARQGYRAIAAALEARGLAAGMEGVLVQQMAAGGTECLVGVVSDPTFGPLLAFGSGGITAELLGDVAFRLPPLTDVDAAELVSSVKVAKLLAGYRGQPAGDQSALRELLLRVSRMTEELPEIEEMDLNPVIVHPEEGGLTVVDARIRVRAAG